MSNNVDWSGIEKIIQEGEALGGSIGVAVVHSNGASFEHNGDRQYGAASTVKIPIMAELYQQIDRGERSLQDPYTLSDEDRAIGSGVMLELGSGMVFTLEDLIYLMISISDNTATNLLIDRAGMDNVNRLMKSLGMESSTLSRKMQGRPADQEQKENWATANDYVRIVQAILENRAASPDGCSQMVAMLEKQQCHRRISRYLPEDPGIRWGSKTGSVFGVTNDVGFILAGDDSLIVSVFCEGLPDQHVGEKVIGDISRAAMAATGIVEPLQTS